MCNTGPAQTVCVRLTAAEPRKHVEWAHIVLASTDRHSAVQVAHALGSADRPSGGGNSAFAESGVAGLLRNKTLLIAADITARLVTLTCTEPPHQATLWTG